METMGLDKIMEYANYCSQSSEKQGWNIKVTRMIAESNPHIVTPEIAERIETDMQPKESFENPIENYDEEKSALRNILDTIKKSKQENLGRSR